MGREMQVGVTPKPDVAEGVPRDPLVVHCGKCGHEFAPAFLPLPMDKVAKVMAKAKCPACGTSSSQVFMGWNPRPTTPGNVRGWIHNGDTGLSSETIWSFFLHEPVPRRSYEWHPAVPRDPEDFGRCVRLLDIAPATWRENMLNLQTKYPEWGPLVQHWAELEALYREEEPTGTCPRLAKRMDELMAALRPAEGFASVLEEAGQRFILDGHHRLAAQLLRGSTEAMVYTYRWQGGQFL